jgi:hypothetical protein
MLIPEIKEKIGDRNLKEFYKLGTSDDLTFIIKHILIATQSEEKT